jgi:ribosome-associated heat shock protein Hsp15
MMVQVRIDIFLKLIGIFKTRSIAGKACKAGCVYLDNIAVKSSHSIQKGDLLEIVKPDESRISVEVLEVPSGKQVSRKDRPDYCRIVGMEG